MRAAAPAGLLVLDIYPVKFELVRFIKMLHPINCELVGSIFVFEILFLAISGYRFALELLEESDF